MVLLEPPFQLPFGGSAKRYQQSSRSDVFLKCSPFATRPRRKGFTDCVSILYIRALVPKGVKMLHHPGIKLRANVKSILHRCHPILVEFVWELTEETVDLPLGCLQGGLVPCRGFPARPSRRARPVPRPTTLSPPPRPPEDSDRDLEISLR